MCPVCENLLISGHPDLSSIVFPTPTGQVPLHPLNYTLLSNETGLSRELVEGCVREVLQALSRSVAARKSIDFDIKDIGR